MYIGNYIYMCVYVYMDSTSTSIYHLDAWLQMSILTCCRSSRGKGSREGVLEADHHLIRAK